MSKFEKSFAGGNPLKADELNQMVAAINDNDERIASLRDDTDGLGLSVVDGQLCVTFNS